jgi:Fic family protein
MAKISKKQKYLFTLKQQLDTLRTPKQSLLTIIEEFELAESVYNSNAIENSTLTLAEYSKLQSKPLASLINSGRRQTIPAFREKGVWKIGV